MWKQIMIELIRKHQYYADGALESMTEDAVKEIYEKVIDWLDD